MGKYNNGIMGPFRGRIGAVVGTSWGGMPVMRSLPRKTTRPPSAAQLAQRRKFGLVMGFLSPVSQLLRKYFGNDPNEKIRQNAAVSYHINNALTGEMPDYAVDFARVIFTKGDLLGFEDAAVTAMAPAQLQFTWADNSSRGQAKTTDMLLLVLYNPDKKLYELREQAAPRTAETFALQLPMGWIGDGVQCFGSMVSADGKLYSTSVYLGAVAII